MPYKNPEDKRANDKLKRAQRGDFELQRERLYRKIRRAFEMNEEQRMAGITVTGLEPKPKKATLEKYGIEVFLADPSMFDLETQTNKNPFIQERRPRLMEAHQVTAVAEEEEEVTPTQTVTDEMTVKIQLVQLRNALDSLEDSSVKKETVDKRWRDFRNLVEWSSCDDIVSWLNDGKLIEYISERTEQRNTKMGYFKSLYFLVVKHNLIPDVSEAAKKQIQELSQDAKETVKYHQLNQEEIDEIMKIKPFSKYLKEGRADGLSETSDEMILLRIYDELTLRDDYANINLFVEDPGRLDEESYYVLSTGTIHFNGFKKTGTDSKRKPKYFSHKFSDSLVADISTYVDEHEGDKLFMKQPRRIAQKIGTNFNTLRKAKIREVYDDENHTLEERKKLAADMKHSWATQLIYAGRTTRSGRRYGQ